MNTHQSSEGSSFSSTQLQSTSACETPGLFHIQAHKHAIGRITAVLNLEHMYMYVCNIMCTVLWAAQVK